MENTAEILKSIQGRTSTINKIVAIVMPVAAVIGGYFWYRNNIWKPKVSLISADYVNNIASLEVNGKERKLYAGSTINAGFGWGVRFAGSATDEYDRIELVKNDLAYETINVKKL